MKSRLSSPEEKATDWKHEPLGKRRRLQEKMDEACRLKKECGSTKEGRQTLKGPEGKKWGFRKSPILCNSKV